MRTILAALLAATLPLAPSATGEAQLLPAGKFAARDGRPGPGKQWEVTDAQGLKLAEQINAIAAKTPIVIDYEHQTMLSEKNGQPAPAAGWIHRVEWRSGRGLFGQVEWTEKAKAHVLAGEYRYISPVILFDKDTGAVTGVVNAALVNHPALLGMEAVAAQLSAQLTTSQESDMDLLALLVSLFGMAAGTTPQQMVDHVTALKAQITSIDALKSTLGLDAKADMPALVAHITALKTQADALASLKTKLGLAATAELAAIVAHVESLKGGTGSNDAQVAQTIAALQGQIATLTAANHQRELGELIDTALREGKLVPGNKAWAEEWGKRDLAALRAWVATAPKVAAGLMTGQTTEKQETDPKAPLSAEALAVCKAMGLTEEQFKAGATA